VSVAKPGRAQPLPLTPILSLTLVQRPGVVRDGYIKVFSDFMISRESAKRITVINKGVGSNTVKDLQNKWYDDVLRYLYTPDRRDMS
jgi:hypothetical protein